MEDPGIFVLLKALIDPKMLKLIIFTPFWGPCAQFNPPWITPIYRQIQVVVLVATQHVTLGSSLVFIYQVRG